MLSLSWAASQVHEDWCIQEYKAFFERAGKIYGDGSSIRPGKALRQACFKGETKRNEITIDTGYVLGHETLAQSSFVDFEAFMQLVNAGAYDIKRFVGRNLTDDEVHQSMSTWDYKMATGEENILRNFKLLSSDSQKENLGAAISAYDVFEQFSKAGFEIEDMLKNEDIRTLIGIAIHTDWMRRNPNHANRSLMVPYSELDEWTKGQDLTVFEALMSVVQKNGVVIAREDDYELPDYVFEELQVLEDVKNKTM